MAFANGVGRSGSILGSVIGGAMVALGWQSDSIFILLAVPALIAAMTIGSIRSDEEEAVRPPGAVAT